MPWTSFSIVNTPTINFLMLYDLMKFSGITILSSCYNKTVIRPHLKAESWSLFLIHVWIHVFVLTVPSLWLPHLHSPFYPVFIYFLGSTKVHVCLWSDTGGTYSTFRSSFGQVLGKNISNNSILSKMTRISTSLYCCRLHDHWDLILWGSQPTTRE